MTSLDGIVSTAALLDDEGNSIFDHIEREPRLPIGRERLRDAVLALREAGFAVLYPGRYAVTVSGSPELYSQILGYAPGVPAVAPLRIATLPPDPKYAGLVPYVAGFVFQTQE